MKCIELGIYWLFKLITLVKGRNRNLIQQFKLKKKADIIEKGKRWVSEMISKIIENVFTSKLFESSSQMWKNVERVTFLSWHWSWYVHGNNILRKSFKSFKSLYIMCCICSLYIVATRHSEVVCQWSVDCLR